MLTPMPNNIKGKLNTGSLCGDIKENKYISMRTRDSTLVSSHEPGNFLGGPAANLSKISLHEKHQITPTAAHYTFRGIC